MGKLQIAAPMHSLKTLQGGVRDFCSVLDQAAIGFVWSWVIFPKIPKLQENGFRHSEAMQVVTNATIESSLISIRTLDEFFAGGGRPNDIRAHHYQGYNSPGRFLKREEFDLIGRRIAHLTTERTEEGPDNAWRITELIGRAYERSAHFLDFVVSGDGKPFAPPAPFDTVSRLITCRKMDGFMQRELRKGGTVSPSTTTYL
jgi:hypothetical protein